jgi:hypothetical protein
MDLNKIKTILLSDDGIVSEVEKRALIIAVIADDEKAIPDILDILNSERRRKQELLSSFNTLLSKADAALDEPKLNKGKFIQKEVKDFYVKNKDYVSHQWKNYPQP